MRPVAVNSRFAGSENAFPNVPVPVPENNSTGTGRFTGLGRRSGSESGAYGAIPCSIFAQVSRRGTVRLNTGLPVPLSGSTQK